MAGTQALPRPERKRKPEIEPCGFTYPRVEKQHLARVSEIRPSNVEMLCLV